MVLAPPARYPETCAGRPSVSTLSISRLTRPAARGRAQAGTTAQLSAGAARSDPARRSPSRRAPGLSPGRFFTEVLLLLLRPRLSRLLSPSRRVLSPSRRVAPRVSHLVDASRKFFFFFSILGCPASSPRPVASCPRPVASRPVSETGDFFFFFDR